MSSAPTPPAPTDAAPAPQARCPRCGARLGRRRATDADGAAAFYCGCCGLVTGTPALAPAMPTR